MITVSSPGKIHLLGEHAVVYGRPALLAAIDRRIYVRIRNHELGIRSEKRSNALTVHTDEDEQLIRDAFDVFRKSFLIEKLPSLKITLTSHVPTGSGLGSSAAVAAATIGALMKHVKNLWNPQKVNELTFEVEKIAHGNPSGADNITVVFGGLVWFRREFDFLKSIWSLPMAGYKIPRFVMIQSGRPKETTKDMVKHVAVALKRKKRQYEAIFADQEFQTKRLLLALKSGNNDEVSQAIKRGEKNLESIGVVGRFAQKIIRTIESRGGVAKICGAGGIKEGSGMLLCYHSGPEQIKKIARKFAIDSFDVKLGEEGIRVENA